MDCYIEGRPDGAEIYFFKGLGQGRYRSSQILRLWTGEPLRPGLAASVWVSDWNRDGKLDLLVGVKDGSVKFVPNLGQMRFGFPLDLIDESGNPISAYNAGPCVVDWDGDGVDDLLLGTNEGALRFYKGRPNAPGLPLLLEAPTLLIAAPQHAPRFTAANSLDLLQNRSNRRIKISPVDWNHDGKLDLLVGDWANIPPYLSPAQQSEIQALTKQAAEVESQSWSMAVALENELLKERGYVSKNEIPQNESQEFYRTLYRRRTQNEAFRISQERLTALRERLAAFFRPVTTHGFVWVYLRK